MHLYLASDSGRLWIIWLIKELKILLGLPWWHSGWESACQCRGHGFEPWSGKIPHATEQLGPWATTTEPARLQPVPRSKRGRDSERPAHRDEEWPPLAATRESPRTETKTQHSQKKNKKKKKYCSFASSKPLCSCIKAHGTESWDFMTHRTGLGLFCVCLCIDVYIEQNMYFFGDLVARL